MIRANRRSGPVLAKSRLLPWKVPWHLGAHVCFPRPSESSLGPALRQSVEKKGGALEREMKKSEWGQNVSEER